MALSVKDAETDRVVRRYAKARGISYTGAIKLAVEEALRREGFGVEEPTEEEAYMRFIRGIQERVARATILDPRHPDEILYDEDGLPR